MEVPKQSVIVPLQFFTMKCTPYRPEDGQEIQHRQLDYQYHQSILMIAFPSLSTLPLVMTLKGLADLELLKDEAAHV